jgi:alpha-galactosidase
MPGEKEDYTVSGSLLMNGGLKLKQAFAANGYNDQTRFFQDFGSRLYFMKETGTISKNPDDGEADQDAK